MHRKRPIVVNQTELDIELVSPTLLDCHDNQSVRVSEITPDLDPEKLRFYLSAVACQSVLDLQFDETRTKAVAQFKDIIGLSI